MSVAGAATDDTSHVLLRGSRDSQHKPQSESPVISQPSQGFFPQPNVISSEIQIKMSDKVSQSKPSQASKDESDPTHVTPKGHGAKPKAPLVPFHQEGPRSPSKRGISSPFTYATAVANRNKVPFTGSVECDQ